MYCLSCASPIPAGQTYCPACGTPVAASGGRPPAVKAAGVILLAAVAFSLVNTIYIWWLVGVSRMVGNFSAILAPVVPAIWIGLVFLMWSGRNWARWLIVATVAWTALIFTMLLPRLASIGPSPGFLVTFGVSAVLLLLRLYAVSLLFRAGSNAWFSRRSVSAPV